MRIVLSIGPRGSGKTTYCDRVIKHYPKVRIFSQDDAIRKQFGKLTFSQHEQVDMAFLWQAAFSFLRSLDRESDAILDMNFMSKAERISSIIKAKMAGAQSISCWYFVTPLQASAEFFMKKPERERGEFTTAIYSLYYRDFHEQCRDIECDHLVYSGPNQYGFNLIRRIDPTDPNQEICFP